MAKKDLSPAEQREKEIQSQLKELNRLRLMLWRQLKVAESHDAEVPSDTATINKLSAQIVRIADERRKLLGIKSRTAREKKREDVANAVGETEEEKLRLAK